ncbi:Yqey-like protein-domain-containing protein [Echria macrotheca]|uniref:Altered inheritance of mitochondria protein 41 n=1 Tax=Echria macrotheca TaxID=438768 RepID=A0AAJ0BCZ0_9PEZI|nr:Yqey-like protein-domain-containing protein [Echria macrotheca]
MSARLLPSVLRLASRRKTPAFAPSRHAVRAYSSEVSQPPPLLTKLKGDLKTAMKTKDAARLSVLRAVLAATLNASKTSAPIKTDVQLVSLLRRTVRSSEEAVAGFRSAGRQDLVDSEEAQIQVLEEYIAGSGVQTLGEAELREAARPIVDSLASQGQNEKTLQGAVMKELLASNGPLAGKQFDKGQLGQVVQTLLKERQS